jgi:hypothetical protein
MYIQYPFPDQQRTILNENVDIYVSAYNAFQKKKTFINQKKDGSGINLYR